MPYVMAHQKTRDYHRWKAAFDSQRSRRAAAGCHHELVLVNEHDPGDVFALMEFDDAARLQDYMAGQELKQAFAEAQLVGNEVHVLRKPD